MKKLLLSIFLLFFTPTLFSFAFAEQRAVLYFSGAGKDYSVGQYININIIADPKDQLFDTVRTVVNFSKDTLQVQSVTLNSIFSVADPDNFYSNANSVISYAAGIPGGTNKPSSFATISFLVKKAGEASISLNNQSIVLSGGENILSAMAQPIKLSINQDALNTQDAEAKPSSTAQQNTQAKPLAVTKGSQKTEQQKSGTAALESGAVPIVEQSIKSGVFEKLSAKKWPFLLALLALFLIFFYHRKNISVFLKRVAHKKDGINGTI